LGFAAKVEFNSCQFSGGDYNYWMKKEEKNLKYAITPAAGKVLQVCVWVREREKSLI
jgi:hypothetical protein